MHWRSSPFTGAEAFLATNKQREFGFQLVPMPAQEADQAPKVIIVTMAEHESIERGWIDAEETNKARCSLLGFKRAFIGSVFVLPFSSNAAIVLILICYGSAAGSLVLALRSRSCPVPSARLPLTQLPI